MQVKDADLYIDGICVSNIGNSGSSGSMSEGSDSGSNSGNITSSVVSNNLSASISLYTSLSFSYTVKTLLILSSPRSIRLFRASVCCALIAPAL